MSSHILVVDDDRAVQEMLADTLRERGYTVSTCRDGKQVMPQLEDQDVDLVILDVLIPHVNGFTLMEQIRAHPTLKELPVILISGIYRSRNHRAEMTGRFGAIDYLDKPLATDRLLELVEQVVGAGGAPQKRDEKEEDVPRQIPSRKRKSPPPTQEHLVDSEARAERQDVETQSRQAFKSSAFVMQGQLKRSNVSAVLGHIWKQQQSGALLLRDERVKKIIYVRDGGAYLVKSNRVSECLGQVLVRERLITEAQCKESIKRMRKTGKRQGEILVDMRAITTKNLEVALELQLETKIFDIFSWDEGDFRFNRGAKLPSGGADLEWTGPALVAEGIRRHFDETRLRKLMIPILDVPLQMMAEDGFDWGLLKLSPDETRVARNLDLPKTSRELIDTLPLDPPDTLRVIYTLIALELLAPDPE